MNHDLITLILILGNLAMIAVNYSTYRRLRHSIRIIMLAVGAEPGAPKRVCVELWTHDDVCVQHEEIDPRELDDEFVGNDGTVYERNRARGTNSVYVYEETARMPAHDEYAHFHM